MCSGETRLVIVSKRSITRGEEITYNYQYFDDDLGDIPRQKCQCGASNCSGTIGGRVVSSEEQKWLDRATSLLVGSKRYSLDVVREHLNQYDILIRTLHEKKKIEDEAKATHNKRQTKRKRAASEAVNFHDLLDEVVFEPPEYKELKLLLSRAEEWRTEALSFLRPEKSKKRTLKVSVLQKLLSRAPNMIKIDEYIEIKSMIERCQRLEKRDSSSSSKVAGQHLKLANGDIFESSTQDQSSNDSIPSAVHLSNRILWDSFLADVKECRAIAPAFCATGVRILQAYQSACSWTNKYLTPYYYESFVSHKKDLFDYMKLVAEDKSTKDIKHLLGHWSLTLWPPIKELGLLYKTVVHPDFLIICDILEENLQMYITRSENLNDSVNTDRLIFNGTGTVAEIHTGTVQSNPFEGNCINHAVTEDDYNPRKLFCFCWLPESACETEALIQCENCLEWFHGPCVNMKTSGNAGKGRMKVSKCVFVCPLCKFDYEEPVDFLFPVVSEWNTSKKTGVVDIAGPISTDELHAFNVKGEPAAVLNDVEVNVNDSMSKVESTTTDIGLDVKRRKLLTKPVIVAEKWMTSTYLQEILTICEKDLCIQDVSYM